MSDAMQAAIERLAVDADISREVARRVLTRGVFDAVAEMERPAPKPDAEQSRIQSRLAVLRERMNTGGSTQALRVVVAELEHLARGTAGPDPESIPPPTFGTLTPIEHDIVDRLGKIATDMSQHIIGVGDGATSDRHGDAVEMVHHIHGLQNMVLAQAAARAYPSLYRPLGGRRKDGA